MIQIQIFKKIATLTDIPVTNKKKNAATAETMVSSPTSTP